MYSFTDSRVRAHAKSQSHLCLYYFDWIAFHMLGSCIGHRVVFITGFQVGSKRLFIIIIIIIFKIFLFENILK